MANIDKIRLSGQTYDILDSTALHDLDNTVTSGGTNAVKGSGIYDAIQTVVEAVDAQHYQTSGDVQSAITAAVEDFFDGVEYISSAKTINFLNGETVKATLDATAFIKDGMVDNVEIKTIQSGEPAVDVTVLAITFNSDAGKEEIDIPLTDIFDASNYYTKAEVDTALSGKQDTLSAGTGIGIAGNVISVTASTTVDQTIIENSTNAVAGGAVYTALQGKNGVIGLDGTTLVVS